MTEEENQDGDDQEGLLDEWPLSNNFILAAILLLIVSAFTLAFRTEEQANNYAIWAYYSLVVGVLLRFVEIVVEERLGRDLKSVLYNRFSSFGSLRDKSDMFDVEHIRERISFSNPFDNLLERFRTEVYICSECGAEFDSKHGLKVHVGRKH